MCGIWHAEVHGELVAVAVVARDDRDRGALHRHDRDTLVLEAPAHDDLGAFERVAGVGSRSPHHDVGADRLELQRRVGRERALHVGRPRGAAS